MELAVQVVLNMQGAAADRTTFALESRSGPGNYDVMNCDAETSPRHQNAQLIRLLTADGVCKTGGLM